MDKITSSSILETLRQRSAAKLDEQRRKINGFARDVIGYSEAMVILISLTGNMHVDLKDDRFVKEILHKLYGDDNKLWSQLYVAESGAPGFSVAQGNARITRKPDSHEEAVSIICTYRFRSWCTRTSVFNRCR
jgi:hypothetical protein